MNGLLINGKIVPADGLTIIGPSDPGGCALKIPEDGCPRGGHVVQQWFVHKTIADDPEKLIPGVGPSARDGGAYDTAYTWAHDGEQSGAHLVVGHDGEILQTADLALIAAYHATVSNFLSVGVETKELVGGGFYEAAAKSVVRLTIAGCRALGIQLMAQWPYHGKPLTRFADGGRTLYGIFGHRDNTSRRGRWDPGDMLFDLLRQAGVVLLDYESDADRSYVVAIQTQLQKDSLYNGTIDGLAGGGTCAALKAAGYIDGIFALGKS